MVISMKPRGFIYIEESEDLLTTNLCPPFERSSVWGKGGDGSVIKVEGKSRAVISVIECQLNRSFRTIRMLCRGQLLPSFLLIIRVQLDHVFLVPLLCDLLLCDAKDYRRGLALHHGTTHTLPEHFSDLVSTDESNLWGISRHEPLPFDHQRGGSIC